MHARTILAHEIERFVEAAGDPDHNEDIADYAQKMFAAGSMRPEWCYIVEETERPSGRVALWTLPGMEKPLDLVLLDVDWGDLDAGVTLLRTVLEEARSLGADEVGHVIDSPPMWPQWQGSPERRVGLLERCGFALSRETSRFEWRRGVAVPAETRRLEFRTLDEVGEAAFVDAIARVSEDTLDREISAEREELGVREAARQFFELELQLEHDQAWCQLAYTLSGDLVGLVMPAKNPTTPVINYIGVVPEQRGRGYVDDLLARGTAVLVAAGATVIRADTDTQNAPMSQAFRRAGYTEFARRLEYGVKLVPH